MVETASVSKSFSSLARRLIDKKLVSEQQVSQALSTSEKGGSLVRALAALDSSLAQPLAAAIAKDVGLPLLDLDAVDPSLLLSDALNNATVQKHGVLPLVQRQQLLFVAIADPADLVVLDEIKFQSGSPAEPILVEADKLMAAIARRESGGTSLVDNLNDEDLEALDNIDVEAESEHDIAADEEQEDAPVVRFINKILLEAINRGASDIHFEPYEKRFRIRYRVDGVLNEIASPPLNMSSRMIARVKVMSRMDISERRIPQDGRIKMKLSRTRAIDFRVNTCPTLFGEKIVLRILDPSSAKLGIEMLGYEEVQRQRYEEALSKPYGMILVTGPTGSGKTVSLYTGLNILNTVDRNISTAEDPAEINLEGINQVNVNAKVGLTFASALRSFLRQDPDVIMVGEIRDMETGSIAIKAAQTGHLVLSTLHTNDAPQTLTRLLNMGIPAFNIASSVSLIIAQRLARRLCKNCKKIHDIPEKALLRQGFSKEEIAAGIEVFQPVGCDSCNAGYKGRVGIYQVLPISEQIGNIIMAEGNALQIAEQAKKEGIDDLRASALKKIKQGLIGLEEANRVTLE